MSRLLVILCCLMLPQSAPRAASLSAGEAVRMALEKDPALAERLAELDAAAGLQRQESSPLRLNPVATVTGSTNGHELNASVVQPLSLSGEGFRAAESARAVWVAAKAAADRARYETAAAARRAYARAVLAREKLRFAEEDKVLLARLRKVAEARVAAGESIDLDLRLARLEEARAMAAWLEAQSAAASSDVELAALVGFPPGDLERDPLAAGPAGPGIAQPRSDLIASRAATHAAEAALGREKAAGIPPVGVGAYFDRADRADTYGLALTLELPVWKRNQSGVGAASGALRHAQALEASLAARAATEAARAAERLTVAEEALEALAPDIGDEARPALRAIEALYSGGQANLVDTLFLRSRVVEGERAWMEARAAAAVARIDVALAMQWESLLH